MFDILTQLLYNNLQLFYLCNIYGLLFLRSSKIQVIEKLTKSMLFLFFIYIKLGTHKINSIRVTRLSFWNLLYYMCMCMCVMLKHILNSIYFSLYMSIYGCI